MDPAKIRVELDLQAWCEVLAALKIARRACREDNFLFESGLEYLGNDIAGQVIRNPDETVRRATIRQALHKNPLLMSN